MTNKSYLLSLNCGEIYIHNNGTHFTTGKQCSDCGRFIAKETLEYFMSTGHLSIWMTINNRRVDSLKKGKKLPKELLDLADKLFDRKALLVMTEQESNDFMKYTYKMLDKHKIKDSESSIILK